jgi:tRNA C32,U32 (ribose-2'-O)-methylase TrmJ
VKTRSNNKTVPQSPALATEKIRRFVRRLNLSAADAELFLGILRQILWKLQ